MLNIAITGPEGLVGSRIIEILSDTFHFIPFTHSDLDITNEHDVHKKLQDADFDMLLHCAAYTNVDGAETEKEKANEINVNATHYLFDATQQKKKKFIYLSTDFVFDGDHPPYDEESTPNPISEYGKSKFKGEQVVKDNAMIVRLSFPYRKEFEKKRDFMRTIKYLLEQKKQITGITDSTFTPTFIDDLAMGLKHLMTHFSPEIFHLVGGSSLTPYDAFIMIAEKFNLDKSLISKTTADEYFKGKAKRPQKAEIVSKKNNFYHMKSFEEGLDSIL